MNRCAQRMLARLATAACLLALGSAACLRATADDDGPAFLAPPPIVGATRPIADADADPLGDEAGPQASTSLRTASWYDPNVRSAEPLYQRYLAPEGQPSVGGYPAHGEPGLWQPDGSQTAPGDFDEFYVDGDYQAYVDDTQRGFLPWGPWRQVRADMTWVDSNHLSFADLELWAIFAMPTLSEETPLVLSPGAAVHLVSHAPGNGYQIPAHLYDLYCDIMLRHRFASMRQLQLDLAVTPGLYTDFQSGSDSDAFRLGARAVADYQWTDELTIRAGVAWLDRDDVGFLPVAGLIWRPNADTIVDLTTPKPRFSRRFYRLGGTERWWHIGGELGGGAWSIQRPGGDNDVVSYYDLRLTVGVTQRSTCGPIGILEAGYVFARQLEFRSGETFEPDNGIMLRAAVGY